jgi:hypothetical protein
VGSDGMQGPLDARDQRAFAPIRVASAFGNQSCDRQSSGTSLTLGARVLRPG